MVPINRILHTIYLAGGDRLWGQTGEALTFINNPHRHWKLIGQLSLLFNAIDPIFHNQPLWAFFSLHFKNVILENDGERCCMQKFCDTVLIEGSLD